jgi:hypothetical protein
MVPRLSVSIPANLKVPGRKPRPADPEAAADPAAAASDPADGLPGWEPDAPAQRSGPPKPLLLLLVGLVLAFAILAVVRGRGGDA